MNQYNQMSDIFAAAGEGDIVTVKRLVGEGCDVNDKDEVCMSIISDCDYHSMQIVFDLIEYLYFNIYIHIMNCLLLYCIVLYFIMYYSISHNLL